MTDRDCVEFLRWALPRLGLKWAGFRKVRGTVCKRVGRRVRALGLADLRAYAAYLEAHDAEWRRLDAMCRIPISRFWRDRRVFDSLAAEVLPALARAAAAEGRPRLAAWSAGCASGEEPYSLRLAWSLVAGTADPAPGLEILATDADPTMLARAKAGRYRESSLRDLPRELADRAFAASDGLRALRPEFRRDVAFRAQDIRSEMPEGPFDLILCRNLAFTYFDPPAQREVLAGLRARLRPGAALVIGSDEALPAPHPGLARWDGPAEIHRALAGRGG